MLMKPSDTAPERRIRSIHMGTIATPVTPIRSIFLSEAGNREQVTILDAVGFDVQVEAVGDWRSGRRVSVDFTSSIATVDLNISGIIHWCERNHSGTQIGIVLQDRLPDEFTARRDHCRRDHIRYPTAISGRLRWLTPHSVSEAATVISYSRDGVRLLSQMAPEVGTEVQFSWQRLGIAESFTGIVRWSVGEGEEFLTGCELTNHLGYAITGISALARKKAGR